MRHKEKCPIILTGDSQEALGICLPFLAERFPSSSTGKPVEPRISTTGIIPCREALMTTQIESLGEVQAMVRAEAMNVAYDGYIAPLELNWEQRLTLFLGTRPRSERVIVLDDRYIQHCDNTLLRKVKVIVLSGDLRHVTETDYRLAQKTLDFTFSATDPNAWDSRNFGELEKFGCQADWAVQDACLDLAYIESLLL